LKHHNLTPEYKVNHYIIWKGKRKGKEMTLENLLEAASTLTPVLVTSKDFNNKNFNTETDSLFYGFAYDAYEKFQRILGDVQVIKFTVRNNALLIRVNMYEEAPNESSY